MGVVYNARDERKVEARDRDPYVAVKVLNDEFRRHPDSLISLQRESRRRSSWRTTTSCASTIPTRTEPSSS